MSSSFGLRSIAGDLVESIDPLDGMVPLRDHRSVFHPVMRQVSLRLIAFGVSMPAGFKECEPRLRSLDEWSLHELGVFNDMEVTGGRRDFVRLDQL